jgi:hypothetical protein
VGSPGSTAALFEGIVEVMVCARAAVAMGSQFIADPRPAR